MPKPAGVLYLNGLSSSFVCDTPEEEDKVNADPFLSLSREGLMVDDKDLLAAQDPEGMGEFIPVAWNKEKVTGAGNLISLENLGKLKKKVEKDFARLAENLKEGQIAVSPLVSRSGHVNPCQWCDFFPVCKRKKEEVRPYRTRISKSELFEEEVE
jgi:ATP-dependent helicase/DNAse subunit B